MESNNKKPCTLPDLLKFRADTSPDTPAFVFRDKYGGRRELSWKQIYDLGGRWASELKKGSIGRGQLVVNTLPNSPERVIAEVGIVMSGAASVNGQCQLADGSDLLYVMRKTQAHAIVLDPDWSESPWNVLAKLIRVDERGAVQSAVDLPHLKRVHFARRNTQNSNEDFLGQLEQLTDTFHADVNLDDLVTVFTTSGTTGFSKIVAYAHKAFSTVVESLQIVRPGDDRDISFNLAPLGWCNGYFVVTARTGGTRVLCDVREGLPADMAEFAWKSIVEEKCTTSFMLPAIAVQLARRMCANRDSASTESPNPKSGQRFQNETSEDTLQNPQCGSNFQNQSSSTKSESTLSCPSIPPENSSKTLDFSWQLTKIMMGGVPITKALVKAAKRLSKSVTISYGGTEFGFISALPITDPETYVDYDAGTPVPGVLVKIVSQEDLKTELPPGEMGSILVKHNRGMKEYLHDPEATKAAFTPDGFFCTGDVGCLDDRGHLIVQGRGSDAIMRGPYIFYPGWLEARIRACPDVSDVVVVGVPDPLVNEELCACLLLTSHDVTVEEVRQFVEKDILASEDDPLSPRPRHYLKFQSFPMTKTNKIVRKEVKEQAIRMLSGQ